MVIHHHLMSFACLHACIYIFPQRHSLLLNKPVASDFPMPSQAHAAKWVCNRGRLSRIPRPSADWWLSLMLCVMFFDTLADRLVGSGGTRQVGEAIPPLSRWPEAIVRH